MTEQHPEPQKKEKPQKYALDWITVTIIVCFCIGMTFLGFYTATHVMAALNPGPDPEYQQYIQIRDASDCTKANDTYCRETYKICVHGYEYCQRQQCPGDIP